MYMVTMVALYVNKHMNPNVNKIIRESKFELTCESKCELTRQIYKLTVYIHCNIMTCIHLIDYLNNKKNNK